MLSLLRGVGLLLRVLARVRVVGACGERGRSPALADVARELRRRAGHVSADLLDVLMISETTVFWMSARVFQQPVSL